MAGLFKKNPKLKTNATAHVQKHYTPKNLPVEEIEKKTHREVNVDTRKGIENLRQQPTKGILKAEIPIPDYDSDSGYDSSKSNKSKISEPPIDYDLGQSNNSKAAKPFIPTPDYDSKSKLSEPLPDYDSDESKNRARDNWNKLINKFKRAVIPEQYESGKLTEALADSVQVKITQQENYLTEIGQGKHIHGSREFDMLRMSPEELKTHQLSYDKSRQALLDHTGKPASTIGKESKGEKNLQAFVMSKEGEIYIASHSGRYETDKQTLSHASFLEGRPAEMTGMISINDNGKINRISDNSGHYQPDEIDMYRGIKKIQETMPGALDKNCTIHLQEANPMYVHDFMKTMDSKVPGSPDKTWYEKGREERIAKIKGYQDKLKNTAKEAAVAQAKRIGKTLLQRKQDDRTVARNITANARKTKGVGNAR